MRAPARGARSPRQAPSIIWPQTRTTLPLTAPEPVLASLGFRLVMARIMSGQGAIVEIMPWGLTRWDPRTGEAEGPEGHQLICAEFERRPARGPNPFDGRCFYSFYVRNTDTGEFIEARVRPTDGGAAVGVKACYLVGADGARSLVRQLLGIEWGGVTGIQREFMGGRMFALYLRAPRFQSVLKHPKAWMYVAVNHERRAFMASVDGVAEYAFHAAVHPHENPETWTQDDARRIFAQTVGAEVPIEILSMGTWLAGHALVAQQFQRAVGDGGVEVGLVELLFADVRRAHACASHAAWLKLRTARRVQCMGAGARRSAFSNASASAAPIVVPFFSTSAPCRSVCTVTPPIASLGLAGPNFMPLPSDAVPRPPEDFARTKAAAPARSSRLNRPHSLTASIQPACLS